jgi:ABC-type molybdate transport system ATPase subunit
VEDHVRIGAAATALGVSIDTLRRWERAGRVTFARKGQQRYLSSEQLAELARRQVGRAGARNRLPGIVLDVRRNGRVAQIELACGAHRVVSLMPRETFDRLGLEPGDSATVVMKPSALVVEPA